MTDGHSIWDPLRKKEVALTPEEQVRQWCIRVLAEQMQVPMHDRSAKPLMVVECKRPEVALTQEVLDQAIRYNIVLEVKYMIITNGTKTFICRRNGDRFEFINTVPTYTEMLCHQQ